MAKILEPNVNVNEVSRISTGTVIKGEISSPNDIRVDGSFEGRIFSKGRIVVGEKAVINGDVFCDNLDFWGKMTGEIYVKDTLTLKDGCVIDCDLHVKRLVVELGARFNGNCKMLSDEDFDKVSSEIMNSKSSVIKPVLVNLPVSEEDSAVSSKKAASGGTQIPN